MAQKTYLQCGNLIDTGTGKVLKEMTVVVEKNMIINVQKGYVNSENNTDNIDTMENVIFVMKEGIIYKQ